MQIVRMIPSIRMNSVGRVPPVISTPIRSHRAIWINFKEN